MKPETSFEAKHEVDRTKKRQEKAWEDEKLSHIEFYIYAPFVHFQSTLFLTLKQQKPAFLTFQKIVSFKIFTVENLKSKENVILY